MNKEGIQIYVLVFWIFWASLGQESMRNLRIKHAIAVDFVLSNEGTGIFAKIVENFDDIPILKHLFKAQREGVDLG